MIRLGRNILSENVQRNLGRATQEVSTVSERLSSGQRINKAADDAAGLAISLSLNTDARIFSQGIRNLNDGISLANIAESSISQLGEILIRVEELAAQSINSTYSSTQRDAMQKEVTALQAEYNRIKNSTTFNGVNLLTGSATRTVLQGGTGTENTLALQFGKEALSNGFDNSAGETTRVSTSSSGAEHNGGTYYIYSAAISADGRYVAFYSDASNLVAGDTNGVFDSFIKDTLTGITTRISTDSSGNQGNSHSSVTAISADGRYVAFNSSATNLVAGDTNGVQDSFIKDTLTGVTTRISTDSSGAEHNGGAYNTSSTAISADGRYVAFYSDASNLVAGDTNGAQDSFIKDTLTGITTRISTDSSGNQGNSHSYVTAISADGRYVAFWSAASNLVAGDTNGFKDSFIKDTLTGVTTRISTDSSGNQGNYYSYVRAISADGRYAVFDSRASNLVAGDTNGGGDVFLRDLSKAGVQELSGLIVSNQASAKVSLDLIQKYKSELTEYKSKIGANTSRLNSFVNVLEASKINYKAAESRITDADIALETSKLVAATIRQQVAASLVAQANQAPQIAINLLSNV